MGPFHRLTVATLLLTALVWNGPPPAEAQSSNRQTLREMTPEQRARFRQRKSNQQRRRPANAGENISTARRPPARNAASTRRKPLSARRKPEPRPGLAAAPAALAPLTSPAQNATTTPATAPNVNGPGADDLRELLSSLPPEQRQAFIRYVRELKPNERHDLRQLVIPLSPEERKTTLLDLVRTDRNPDSLDALKQRVGIAPDPALPPMTIAARQPESVPYHSSGLRAGNVRLPQPGNPAPSWTLETIAGVPLSSDALRSKPFVLQFGSITCPVYRAKIPAMTELRRKHADRANFLMVYTVEAHPQGSPSPYSTREWLPQKNILDAQLKPQPSTIEQRRQYANETVDKLGESFPVALDTLENPVWKAFGARANSAFLIGTDGRIALAQEWADTEALDAALTGLLPSSSTER